MKKNTKYIHAGVHPDPATGAIMTPIYQTSTYVQNGQGQHKGFEYSRTGNPTRKALEDNLAAIENGKYGLCFGSGMAAMDAVIKLLSSGDEVIASNDLYGGSYRLLTKVFNRFGISSKFIDMSNTELVRNTVSSKTKLVWVETPTNPLLRLVDIAALSEIARNAGAICCVDNTFATPHLQNPIDLGAHIVLHSATKYLGGHSDCVLGALIVSDDKLAEQLYFIQNSCGAIAGPMDSFLVLRGIKTLHVRLDRGCQNAMEIARFLESHPQVEKVHYPGLESNSQYELAKKQMTAFGAMVSVELKDDSLEAAQRFLEATEVFSLAESLGGVESLIGHPASMTHASIPRDERLAAGLRDGLIRLSVGIEDVEDLKEDLMNAFKAL